jgi:3-deoxy-D-manno-octulosonic-acid transferase
MNKSALYSALSLFSSVAVLPFVGLSFVKPRLRSTLRERLGFSEYQFRRESDKPLVLFHAASLGEFIGLRPLLQRLKELNQVQIVVSTTSDTGKAAATESGLSSFVTILPFDHPLLCARFLKVVSPDLVIISETEIWPSFLLELSRRKIPLVYVNARISDYTARRYKLFSFLFKRLLSGVLELHAQTETDAQRFLVLGVQNVHVSGNTKFDLGVTEPTREDKNVLRGYLDADVSSIWVAGSVREGEDGEVIQTYKNLLVQHPTLGLIIAPRHPENFERVAEQLRAEGIPFVRRSERPENSANTAQVLLLDTVGELANAYRIGDLAFVGGSLVDIGGHNPMEPAACGVPVLVGPYTATVRDFVEILSAAGGLFQLQDRSGLERQLKELLSDSELRMQSGEAARRVWLSNLGASERLAKRISALSAQPELPQQHFQACA